MKFANIEMLFLFWAVPLLALAAWYGMRRRRTILEKYSDERTLAMLVPRSLSARRRIRAVLVLTAALLLVLAAAGPRYGFQWQKVERRGVDLIIALDCSRSMLARDIQPTRLDRAKREIVDLLGMLRGDRVGLVAFSGTAFLQCPLTLDYSTFDLFLNVLDPDYLPTGGTDLSAAVHTALDGFDDQSPADRAVILITDGEHTGPDDPEAAARAAEKAGVKLFCIGVGSSEGVPVPSGDGGFKKDAQGQIVMSRLDEPTLTRMAVTTGGTYVRSVAGDMDLDVIYRDQILAEMTDITLESGRKKVWADRYQWPLAVAVIFLMAARAVPLVKKRVVGLALLALLAAPQGQSWAGPLQEGVRAYRQENYEQALDKFIAGQLDDPDNPEVLYNLGNTYYKSGDYPAAREHFGQALSQAPPALKAKLLYNLGNTAYRQGALQEAVKNYEAALQLAPGDRQARENLAYVKQQIQKQQQQQQGQGDSQPDPAAGNRKDSAPSTARNDEKQPPPQTRDRTQEQTGSKDTQRQAPSEPATDEPRPAQGGDPSPSPESSRPQQAQSGQAAGDQGDEAPPPAAARMLNRLKDEPGRAMMPRYEKVPVEKDW